MKFVAKFLVSISLTLLLTSFSYASTSCIDTPRLTGVNLAGAEFNSKQLPGIINKDYTYPRESELSYIASQGANVIRLPFRWERIQNAPFAELNGDELKRLQWTVNTAKAHGLCVILDVHNYAKYFGQELGEKVELQEAFVDLWLRLAAVFNDPHSAVFGLMNEPKYIPLPDWAKLAKRTLAALREAKSSNMVFIGGGHWSGLHDWFGEHDGQSNAAAFADLKDPLNRVVLETHQYADEYYSGTATECYPPEHFTARFQRITTWAKDNNQRLFLGEFGVPQNEVCMQTLSHFMSLVKDPVWKGWSYWAAGGWWGDYPFALNTNSTTPSLQWRILQKNFYPVPTSKGEASPPKPPADLSLEKVKP